MRNFKEGQWVYAKCGTGCQRAHLGVVTNVYVEGAFVQMTPTDMVYVSHNDPCADEDASVASFNKYNGSFVDHFMALVHPKVP